MEILSNKQVQAMAELPLAIAMRSNSIEAYRHALLTKASTGEKKQYRKLALMYDACCLRNKKIIRG